MIKVISIDTETSGLNPDKNQLLEIGIVLYDSCEHPKIELNGEYHSNFKSSIDSVVKSLFSARIILVHPSDNLEFDSYVFKLNKRLILPMLTESFTNFNSLIDISAQEECNKTLSNLKVIEDDEHSYSTEVLVTNNPEDIVPFIYKFMHSAAFITTDEYNVTKMNESISVVGKNYYAFDHKFLSKIPNWNKMRLKHRSIDPAILYYNPMIHNEVPNLSDCIKASRLFPADYAVAHDAVVDAKDTIKLILPFMNSGNSSYDNLLYRNSIVPDSQSSTEVSVES